MDIKEQVSLAPHTTLQIGGNAEYFAEAKDEAEIMELVTFARERELDVTVIGGGSNVLVSDEGVKGLVIKNRVKGISRDISGDDVLVTAGAGEEWDVLVERAVSEGWWGIENLSAIPGSVGATPIQNVGAYGVEIVDVFKSVRALHAKTGETRVFSKEECQFGYRDSIFKTAEGHDWIVLFVTFRLSLSPDPKLHYKDLKEKFALATEAPSLKEIREAVISIRQGKFPDWRQVGTAGSFFKNPVIPREEYERLAAKYPGLPGFADKEGHVKVSLGWILDHACSLRGHREGNVGLYDKQALVLINWGGASAKEVKEFANRVSNNVFEKTKIKIEFEVRSI